MTLISKNCQKSVTKTSLDTRNFLMDTRNIVPSVQSALSPHKYWAERHFASKFGTQHLGGGRSTGLTASPPHPGRPLRGLPIGQADGDRSHTVTQSRSPAGISRRSRRQVVNGLPPSPGRRAPAGRRRKHTGKRSAADAVPKILAKGRYCGRKGPGVQRIVCGLTPLL